MTRVAGEFGRAALIAAFETIGAAAVANGIRLDLAVYGGSALMLAGNFRFSTEDVDIAKIGEWPAWLVEVVGDIGRREGWSENWLNAAVAAHLSPVAERGADHMVFGSFPREGPVGLTIMVPTAEYLLALKLKAMRTNDPVKGRGESDDIFHLMRVVGIDTAEAAVHILARYFPASARDAGKQRFLPKHLAPSDEARSIDAPTYAGRGLPTNPEG